MRLNDFFDSHRTVVGWFPRSGVGTHTASLQRRGYSALERRDTRIPTLERWNEKNPLQRGMGRDVMGFAALAYARYALPSLRTSAVSGLCAEFLRFLNIFDRECAVELTLAISIDV